MKYEVIIKELLNDPETRQKTIDKIKEAQSSIGS